MILFDNIDLKAINDNKMIKEIEKEDKLKNKMKDIIKIARSITIII